MVKYKFFTDKFGSDLFSNIEPLREYFGKLERKKGVWDKKPGIFAISDLSAGDKDYQKPIKSKVWKDVLFFPPNVELSLAQKQNLLDSFEKKTNLEKISVELECGVKLKIIPAAFEPRKLSLSLIDDDEEEEFITDYGKEAYRVAEILYSNDESISFTIKDGIPLSLMGFSKTYTMPIDLLNWLGIISDTDIEKMIWACCGVESFWEDDKKKEEIEDSNQEQHGQQDCGRKD